MPRLHPSPMLSFISFLVWLSVSLWSSSYHECEALAGSRGYTVTSIKEAPDGRSFTAFLQVIDGNTVYGPDIQCLRLVVRYESESRLRVYISDADKPRWEVPRELLPRDDDGNIPRHQLGNTWKKTTTDNGDPELQFNYTIKPFGFAITRRSTGEVLFNSTVDDEIDKSFGNLVFKDQYLEISTTLPSSALLYGVGENTRPTFSLSHNTSYTLWNVDIFSANTFVDLYGSHPFYMDIRREGSAHGVLLLNSNGMDIEYGGSFLTYRAIGGVLDFYFFAGPSPLSVVQQYTDIAGRPAPMPYWSFGIPTNLFTFYLFVLAVRYGYKHISDLESVVAGYAAAKIPLEAICTDIDHMDGYKDFTLDPVNFPEKEMRQFVDQIHANGQKYVLIVDPGIGLNETYKTFRRGKQDDIFVKHGGVPYLGQVWPGPVYFPDFLNPKIEPFWTREISEFHEIVPFDGLWLDMNEIANLCDGGTSCTLPNDMECPKKDAWQECCLVCSNANLTQWDDPPYKINAAGIHRPLGKRTVPASAVHYNDILEYNAHNLYGFSEVIVTNKALKSALKKRPFVLGRSTFVGSGAHAAHWTGDNAAQWIDLAYTIPTILNFGLFGVPMVGADICGFRLDTTEELCNRWVQLGSFYPFARDHSDIDTIGQELYSWKSVAESARTSLGLRYRLLPHIYTLSFEAHSKGSPIARPLFFTFPEDPYTLRISSQFLLGKGILVSPVLKQGATTVDAYFPKGTWYNLFNVSNSVRVESGSHVRLDAPLDTINVHVYEGNILAMQEGGMTTRDARRSPFSLLVALGGKMEANGELFLDNGESLEMRIERGKSTYVEFYANVVENGVSLRSQVHMGEYAIREGWILEKVIVLGFNSCIAADGFPHSNDEERREMKLDSITDGNALQISSSSSVKKIINHSASCSDDHNSFDVVLEISGLSLPIGKNLELIIPWKRYFQIVAV
eukprot:Gb_01074 [translate_table: standard]